MDFIDYCIKTKNYSVLQAINNYTKTFANKKAIAAATVGTAALAGTAAVNRDLSRGIRKLTGNETEWDKNRDLAEKYIERLGLDDKRKGQMNRYLDDLEDSKLGREIRAKHGETTLRDRWHNLIGKDTDVDKIREKYGDDPGFFDRIRMNRDLEDTYFKDDDLGDDDGE